MKESSYPPVFATTAHDFSGSEEAMEMDDATVHKPAKISGFSADEAMELLDETFAATSLETEEAMEMDAAAEP